jgi:integrase
VFTQEKNKRCNPVRLEIPIVPELQRIIDCSPVGELSFLVTKFKRPFTAGGFGNRMRAWCDEAGLPHCSAHGLRKAAAARLAEYGATEHEIMAVTGHKTLKEVTRYTRAARQRVLADSAMKKLTAGYIENEIDPPKASAAPSGSIWGKKA